MLLRKLFIANVYFSESPERRSFSPTANVFFNVGQSRPLFVYFVIFTSQIKFKSNKAHSNYLWCLGFEPGTVEWWALTDPLSYLGHPTPNDIY